MSVVKRSLLLATGENYVTVMASLVTLVVVSRLLAPDEIGVYVLGSAAMTMALAVREFAAAEFLVQRPSVSREDVQTSFTVLTGLSLFVGLSVWLIAPLIASFYSMEGLVPFLRMLAVAAVIDSAALPIIALFRREMAFGQVAAIRVIATAVTSLMTCGLAWVGFSFMSFAWAALASAVTTVALALIIRPDFTIFAPSLKSWRAALSFGGYNGICYLLGRASETIPLMFLGRVMPVSAVALFNRANVICLMPDRVLLSGLFSVALPALATEVRAGRSLRQPYLNALNYLAAVYWPAQMMLLLLAYPLVDLTLGQQWVDTVPLVQIISLAAFFRVPLILTQPVLVAVDAFRQFVICTLIITPISIVVFCAGGLISIEAFAAGYLITYPARLVIQQYFIQKHLEVRWTDLAAAFWKGAVVTVISMLGPLGIIALSGFSFEISPAGLAAGLLSGGLLWLLALYAVRHPFLGELRRITGLPDGSTLRLRLSVFAARVYGLQRSGRRS